MRIVRLFLEDEDSTMAEQYMGRATMLVGATKDPELLLHVKLCQARLYDYQRRFLEAATRYHELSWTADVVEEERTLMLSVTFFVCFSWFRRD